MTKRNSRGKRCRGQILTLPELDQSKTAVLNSLGSVQSRRSYRDCLSDSLSIRRTSQPQNSHDNRLCAHRHAVRVMYREQPNRFTR